MLEPVGYRGEYLLLYITAYEVLQYSNKTGYWIIKKDGLREFVAALSVAVIIRFIRPPESEISLSFFMTFRLIEPSQSSIVF